MEPWRAVDTPNGGPEAKNGAMEPWRVCMPGVADLNQLVEEPDPDPHGSEIWIRIRIKVKRQIRIRICSKSDADPQH
jgi:hypothetical protein